MAEASNASGQPIDAQHWSWRWRVNGIELAIIAVGCGLSGLSFVARHRYAWAARAERFLRNSNKLFEARSKGSVATSLAASRATDAGRVRRGV